MHGTSILQEIVLLYALALALLMVLGRVRVPTVVGLILAGIIAGPGELGIVRTEETVTLLSEIGVALLLFMVGLDLSFGEVRRLWKSVLFGGGAQVVGTVALVVPAMWLVVQGQMATAICIGLFVAISNTSILIRELTRRNELHAPHGRLAVGILLLQDLLALVALVLLPVLLGASANTSLAGALLRIVLVAAALAGVARFLLPVLFRMATASGREAFVLMVLVASLGTAWLASVLGLSMTVGAFLAGLVLDESEFSHQIHAEIRPLRDLLSSLFFMSVGLLIQPMVLLPVLHLVVGGAAAIVVLKTLGAGAALLLARVPVRVAGAAALALAQIGEFSFVLGQSAVSSGVIPPDIWQVLLGASVLTMMVTPWLVGTAPAFGSWLAERLGRRSTADATTTLEPGRAGHVVILGYGMGGKMIGRTLREIGTEHVILELNGETVREGVATGDHILYADATAAEPLKAAGIAHASAVVAVLSDPGATERAIRAVRTVTTRVPIIVRTRYQLEADRMMRAGATLAVAEEFEASLEVMGQMLVRLDVPGNVAEVLVASARRLAGAETSARPTAAPRVPSAMVSGAVGNTPVASYQVSGEDWALRRSIAEVNLRAETGATILALKRARQMYTTPPVEWVFESGDVLYLAGDDADIQLARARLSTGPRSR